MSRVEITFEREAERDNFVDKITTNRKVIIGGEKYIIKDFCTGNFKNIYLVIEKV